MITQLKKIIPAYDRSNQDILDNRKAVSALDNYVCRRINEIDTSVCVQKFVGLSQALRAIPKKRSESLEFLQGNFPQIAGHLILLEHCIESYQKILAGELTATEVLFPNGSFDLVEKVYCSNPIADHFNKIVAKIARNYITLLNKSAKILEIGAGTGGTTRFVLSEIKDFDVDYTFSDLSLSFLNKAKRKFSEYPFVCYRVLDIFSESNENPDEKYDIIIATNVIHATADLNVSLKNICNRLKKDGIFILNEITTIQNFATVVFGLTDGWWLYRDAYRIENSPLVTEDNWKKLMENNGMSFVGKYGDDGQQVMIATKRDSQGNHGNSKQTVNEKSLIREIISKVMMMDETEIDNDVPFQEYGIDSIISLELLKPLKEVYGYLPATLLFEYPTVSTLSEYLHKNFKGEHVEAREEIKNEISEKTPSSNMNSTTNLIEEIISKVMMMDRTDIDGDVPFQEYGIDSIISLELLKPLKEVYGYLPATLLFEYPTVNALAKYLRNNFEDTKNPASSSEQADNTAHNQIATQVDFRDDDIAIIGMAGIFPQANSLDDFANNLMQGKDCSSSLPSDRWTLDGFIKEDSPLSGGSYTDKGAFMEDVYAFDNNFFNLTPNESVKMDPQERLFLQNAFHLVQDAGYTLSDLKESNTGVYVGVMNSAYCLFTLRDGENLSPTSLRWSIANRVSYMFDLRGPSMAIDSACSSSLTALHLACQALKTGDCEQAIVGGVNLILHPKQYEALCALYMLSKTGICKPFGKGADGFVDSEGIGSVFIKKYKDAVADNDRIYAVVRGTSANAGGKANGYTAPNAYAQSELVKKALERANVDPAEIGYIETHGTGTELGDPIEIRGLSQAFATVKDSKIAIGSVKSNIGHLESAAGISGLIKVVLQMQKSVIFPSIHADEENPHVSFKDTPFYVNKKLKQCTENEISNACVSSFGAGGANAHVVLSKAQEKIYSMEDREFYFITVSSKSLSGLQKQLTRLSNWLSNNYADMYSLAYTLNCARDHFIFRKIFVVKNQTELVELLKRDLVDFPKYSTHNLSQETSDIIARYEKGEKIDWKKIYSDKNLISIPLYEFEKNYFRVDSEEYPLPTDSEIISQHNIEGKCIAPAALVISKLFDRFGASELRISNLKWLQPITSFDQIVIDVQDSSDMQKIKFISKNSNEIFCEADCQSDESVLQKFDQDIVDYRFIQQQQIYDFFKDRAYMYGEYMQSLQWAKVCQNCTKGFLFAKKDWGYSVSPSLLDGGLQLAVLLFNTSDGNFVPISLDECHIRPFDRNEAVYCYCIVKNNPNTKYEIKCDFYYVNSRNEILVKFLGLKSVKLRSTRKSEKVERKCNVLHFD
jgi:3-oxoacyl-(acyl-carrier-protein) synthase/acyl carrier protein/2-polyprenyl-3-methyl-5-hydroxy-6-metoxy-1,4-benzoquinol methylase